MSILTFKSQSTPMLTMKTSWRRTRRIRLLLFFFFVFVSVVCILWFISTQLFLPFDKGDRSTISSSLFSILRKRDSCYLLAESLFFCWRTRASLHIRKRDDNASLFLVFFFFFCSAFFLVLVCGYLCLCCVAVVLERMCNHLAQPSFAAKQKSTFFPAVLPFFRTFFPLVFDAI